MVKSDLTNISHSKAAKLPPVKMDVFYAMITLGSRTLWAMVSGWLLYFYVPPEGPPLVPAALYGGLMLVTSIIQAIADPPIGYWSDHNHSHWGRRRPFLFISALPMLVFFVLLWTPPVQGESLWNLIYLGVILSVYKVLSSFQQIPYRALLPELALTEQHRVRMSSWFSSFELVGMTFGSLTGPAIEKLGYVTTALLCAVVLLPLFYLPLLVLRELPNRQIPRTQQLSFWQDISITLRNRAFLVFIATRTLCWGAAVLVQAVIPFIVTEICMATKGDTIYFYIPAIIASLLCYPLIRRISKRWGKRRVFSFSLLVSAIVLPGLLLIGRWFPVPLLIQGIIWITLEAMAIAGFSMLQSAFIAEITDYDEIVTAQRREGAYYAVWGFFGRIIKGVGEALLPLLLLLGRSHADPNGPLGIRMVGVVGGILMLAAFFIFARYPLKHGQMG